MGRKSTYNAKVATEICNRIADGVPLRQICRDLNIAWRTVYEWREARPEFSARFARARDMGMDAILEEALEIANTPLPGKEVTKDRFGTSIKTSDMLGHRKLQIETRLKLLAKWNPTKYGDKVETTHKGDPGAPVALILNGSDIHG